MNPINIRRHWTGTRRRMQVAIHTPHPDGEMYRGTIRAARRDNDPAGRMTWYLTDPDHNTAEHLGDYRDAEQALLAMSPDLNHVDTQPDDDYLRDLHNDLLRTTTPHQEAPMSITATAPTATPSPNPDAASVECVVGIDTVALRYHDAAGKELESHPLPAWNGEGALKNAATRLVADGYVLMSTWYLGVNATGDLAYAATIVPATKHLTRS